MRFISRCTASYSSRTETKKSRFSAVIVFPGAFHETLFRDLRPRQKTGKTEREDRVPVRNAVPEIEMECDGPVVRKGPGARRGLPQRSVEQLLLPARQDGVVEWFAAPDAQRYEQIPRRYADPHIVEQITKRLRL